MTVLAHNDVQENNILASLEDNENIMIIDFEYTGWAPRAMDLANYFNETMLDNAYPMKNGIKLYLNNFINDAEQELVTRTYLDCYYDKYFLGEKNTPKSDWIN